MDFAFFAANFGYSKADYDSLTPREINFLYKAWENRVIADSYHLYNAVFTAVYNVNRPKDLSFGAKTFKQQNKLVKIFPTVDFQTAQTSGNRIFTVK